MLVSNMRMGKCPYCQATIASDDRGLYHERPTCDEWVAKMATLPVTPAGVVNAFVVHVDNTEPDPEAN
jgi:hypothetical protein